MAWQDSRPIFYRLPQKGYQDNDAADWLTSWVDKKYTETATLLENFWQNLIPETCPEVYLDYLAYICGLSGQYWDITWEVHKKRQMIILAHSLWSSRGTLKAIKTVLDIHLTPTLIDEEGLTLTDEFGNLLLGIPEYSIWTNGALRLTFTLPATFGRDDLRLWVRLPLKYQRTSKEFKECQRTLRNYAPAVVKSGVCFERFYLGFSRLGDALFSS